MHLELRYVTRFIYPSPVWDSHNALRARPADSAHQQLAAYNVTIDPHAKVFTYLDNWGTQVDCFSIAEPHGELIVEAKAVVDTVARPRPPADVAAATLRDDSFREDHWAYLQPSRHVRWGDEVAVTTRKIVESHDDVASQITAVQQEIAERLEYRAGTTVVGTSVSEIWDRGAGVCQDFSHVMVAMLRSAGIPSRYVSGYLYAADPSAHDSHDEGEVVVQTHAWIEAAIPGWGWWGVDPTNAGLVGERHITIGHGRDYEDVMPLRGVYHGDTKASLAVEVTMGPKVLSTTRLPTVTVDQ